MMPPSTRICIYIICAYSQSTTTQGTKIHHANTQPHTFFQRQLSTQPPRIQSMQYPSWNGAFRNRPGTSLRNPHLPSWSWSTWRSAPNGLSWRQLPHPQTQAIGTSPKSNLHCRLQPMPRGIEDPGFELHFASASQWDGSWSACDPLYIASSRLPWTGNPSNSEWGLLQCSRDEWRSWTARWDASTTSAKCSKRRWTPWLQKFKSYTVLQGYLWYFMVFTSACPICSPNKSKQNQ